MNSKRIDLYLSLLLIVLVIFSANEVFLKSYHIPISGGQRVSLGKILSTSNEVRKRSFDQLAWQDAQSSERLYSNDRIFTDTNSKAIIKFDGGNELNVDEETLFQLSVEGESVNIDLQQGIIFATLSNTSQAFVVVVDNEVFQISSSKAKLRIDKKKGKLSVLEGRAKIKSAASSIEVDSGQSASLKKSLSIVKEEVIPQKPVNMPELPPKISSPHDKEEFYVYNGDKLKLSWSGNIVDKRIVYKVKVNDKTYETSDKYLFIDAIDHTKYKWSISYFYKAENEKDSKEVWSKEYSFYTLVDSDESSLKEGRKIVLQRPGDTLLFSWQGVKSSNIQYILEVSKDRSFKEVIKNIKTKNNEMKLSFDRLGTYYWRSKVINNSGEIEYLKPKKIKVIPPKPPEAPRLKTKYIKKVTQNLRSILDSVLELFIPSAQASSSVILEWESIRNVQRYLIEIYQGGELVVQDVSTTNLYDWSSANVGQYQWRVASVDYWDQVGEFSALSTLIIEKEIEAIVKKVPLDLISPYHGRRYRQKSPITLKWKGELLDKSEKFTVELSKDRSFKQVKKYKTSLTTFKIKGVTSNQFYWRIRNGDQVSKKRRIEILKKSKVLTKLPTKKVTSKKSVTSTQYGFSYRPQLIKRENLKSESSIRVDGLDLVSFALFYKREFDGYGIKLDLLKSSAKAFDDLDFSQNRLNTQITKEYRSYSFGLGLSLWNGSLYSVKDSQVIQERESELNMMTSFDVVFDSLLFSGSIYFLNQKGADINLSRPFSVTEFKFRAGIGFEHVKVGEDNEQSAVYLIFSKIIL